MVKRDMTDQEDYPLFLYEYNFDGQYNHPMKINNANELRFYMEVIIKPAIEEKREIRITDTDDFINFHAVDGKILYPTLKDIPNND